MLFNETFAFLVCVILNKIIKLAIDHVKATRKNISITYNNNLIWKEYIINS